MERGGLGLLVLFLATPAWSAATLTGVVSLLREHGQPARGVEISAKGANVVTTGDDGLFVLMLPQDHPGQDVRVGVKRAGLPDTSNARALEIIVCPSAERERDGCRPLSCHAVTVYRGALVMWRATSRACRR